MRSIPKVLQVIALGLCLALTQWGQTPEGLTPPAFSLRGLNLHEDPTRQQDLKAGLEEWMTPRKAQRLLPYLLWGVTKKVRVQLVDFPKELHFPSGETIEFRADDSEIAGFVRGIFNRIPSGMRVRWETNDKVVPFELRIVLRRRQIPKIPAKPLGDFGKDSADVLISVDERELVRPRKALPVIHRPWIFQENVALRLLVESLELPTRRSFLSDQEFLLSQRLSSLGKRRGMKLEAWFPGPGKPLSFLVYRARPGRGLIHLLSFAIHPGSRGKGVGLKMMAWLKQRMYPNSKLHTLLIAVRASDLGPLNFFKGMKEHGMVFESWLEPGYFQDTGEEAVLFRYVSPAYVDLQQVAAGLKQAGQGEPPAADRSAAGLEEDTPLGWTQRFSNLRPLGVRFLDGLTDVTDGGAMALEEVLPFLKSGDRVLQVPVAPLKEAAAPTPKVLLVQAGLEAPPAWVKAVDEVLELPLDLAEARKVLQEAGAGSLALLNAAAGLEAERETWNELLGGILNQKISPRLLPS